MTIEIALIITGLALAACYVVLEYQKLAKPPYQEPVKPDMAEQWVAATKADTLDNIDAWNMKIGDKIWHKADATPINPKAAWPFPSGPKP